jgi:hypothetical protein
MPFTFLKDYSLLIKPDMIKTQFIEDLRLRDTVIVINFNNSWIVVPLLSLTYYPFLYFKNDETKEVATLVICLLTMRTMFIYDKVTFDSYEDYQIKIKMDDGTILYFDDINNNIKKSQAKIQSLRSALIEYNDVKYLHIDKYFNKPIIKMDYYVNSYDYENREIVDLQFHPKTLYTVISYLSSKNNEDNKTKITLIIPEGANNLKAYGYEPKKAKIDQYLAEQTEKLIEKKAFIYHVLAYTARIIYKDAKVITL